MTVGKDWDVTRDLMHNTDNSSCKFLNTVLSSFGIKLSGLAALVTVFRVRVIPMTCLCVICLVVVRSYLVVFKLSASWCRNWQFAYCTVSHCLCMYSTIFSGLTCLFGARFGVAGVVLVRAGCLAVPLYMSTGL